MKRNWALVAVVLIAGAFVSIVGTPVSGQSETDEAESIVVEELARNSLATAKGKQAIVVQATLPPGAAMEEGASVSHPAEEFVYVLEGSAEMTREGEETLSFGTGDAWYNDLTQPHTLENASSREPLTVLAIWIGEKGAF